MQNFDLIVVGAGPGGYVGAIKAAQRGMRVALVERDSVGGACLNRGCIPTKALLHTAQLYRALGDCAALGIQIDGLGIDLRRMYAHKEELVTRLREGIATLLRANKIELIKGEALVTGAGQVRVTAPEGVLELRADRLLLATGAQPVLPPIPGLELPGVLTSDGLLEQEGSHYESLLVIGGGVIGMEFATLFNALGCKVTVVEALERILPGMDRELSQNLSMIMKRRGVDIHTAASVQRIEQGPEGLTCHFEQKGEAHSVVAQAVLAAVGRRPGLEGLFAPGVDIKCERGVVVDEQFMTSLPGVYAIGDMVQGNALQLAHVASAHAANAVAHMAGHLPEMDLRAVPSCIYTDPEIATVGLSADQAKAQGIGVKTGKYSMAGNGKSIVEGQDRGFIKLVFEENSEVLLGAQLMCGRATDMVAELATAVSARLTATQLAAVIRPHPTYAEGVTEAVEDLWRRATHIAPRR